MQLDQIQAALAGLPLGGIRWFETLGSTNDEAAGWAASGAPHLALVIAGEQTAGRGRRGRTWLSPAGSSLAFSLILQPAGLTPALLPQLNALGALALVRVLRSRYQLPAELKYPNDVLVCSHKVCGVLVEAAWDGDRLASVIVGIGINVASNPVMAAFLEPSLLPFPPASLQDLLRRPVDPIDLLHHVLQEFCTWLPRLDSPAFVSACQEHLAFRGQWVQVEQSPVDSVTDSLLGKVLGLSSDGSLRLLSASGSPVHITASEVHLRPLPVPSGLPGEAYSPGIQPQKQFAAAPLKPEHTC